MDTERLNLLMVEGNEDDFVLVRDLLREIDPERFVLEWAQTYGDGLAALREQQHDAVLLDLRLPGGTGLAMLRETQALPRHAPVILLTGQGDHDEGTRAMGAGAADFLVKDRLDADLLERAIRYAVERHRSAEALRDSENRYRMFVENSTEGIWRFELEEPMPTGMAEEEQIAHLERYAYVAECNEAMARIYGYDHASDILGARFGAFLSVNEASDDNYLRRLIHNRYRLVSTEALVSDRAGQPKYVLHNLIGVVEQGLLSRIWGSQADITEQKRGERAQAHLASIVEVSSDAIISTNLDGLIVTWNKGAEALYGYTAQEVTGQVISCLIPPDRSEEMGRIIACTLRGERVAPFDTVRLHKDGRRIDASLAVSPIHDSTGQVIGSSSIARDISEQKRTETRLRRSEANLASAQRIAHFGSWEIDLVAPHDYNANPLRWSDESHRIFGYEPGTVSVTRELFMQAVPPEDRPAIKQAVATAIAERQHFSLVHRVRRPNGEERIVRQTAQVFEGEAPGQSPRLVGTVHDITEQQRAEEHLRFNDLLLSQVRNAVIATDLAGKITYWNNFAETLYQWKAAEAVGRNIADLVISPSQSRREAEQIMDQVRKTGIWEGEFTVQRKDGSTFPAHVVDTLFRDANGAVTGVVGVSIDITERKTAEDTLRQQTALIRMAGKVTRVGGWALEMPEQRVTWSDEIFDLLECPRGTAPSLAEALALYPQPSRDNIAAAIRACAQNGTSFDSELKIRTRTGREIWARVVGEAERETDGAIRRVHGAFQDITERKQAEETEHQREQEFETLVENAPDIISRYDRQFRHLYVNRIITQVTGLPAAAFVGKTHGEIGMPPHLAAEWRALLEDVFTRGAERETEYDFQTPSGTRYYHSRLVPERAPDGSIHSVLNIARDITERKEADAERSRVEEALRASEHKLRLALESGRFGTFDLDLTTGRYLEISGIARDQFALPPGGDVLMSDFFRVVHPSDLAEVQAVVGRASAAQETDFGSDYRVVLPDGSLRWISLSASLIYDDAGLPIRMLGITQDITDRKWAEEALRRAEQEQRDLVARLTEAQALARVGSWEMDLNTQALNWSDETYRIFEMDRAEFGGTYQDFLKFVHPDDRAALNAAYTASVSDKTLYAIDHRLLLPDGRIKFVHERCQTFYDDEGNPVRSVGTIQDVTANRIMVEALRKSEYEYRRIVETTHEGVVQLDADARIVYVNQRYCQMLGYTAEELLGRSLLDLMDDESRALAQEAFARRRQGVTEQIDRRLRHKDGSTVWAIVSVAPLYDEDGRMIGSLGMATDITERKRIEDALILRDKAVQASSNGILVADVRQPDMPTVFVNPAFERVTGYSADEVLGRNCRFLQGTETDQPGLGRLRAALAGGESVNLTLRNYRKDGNPFWNDLSLAPIHDAQGALTHYVGIQNDITERRQAEEERDRFFTLSLDMLAIFGSDGYIKRLNPAFEATLGFTDAELTAKPFLEFVHPDDVPATLAEVEKLEHGIQVMRFENRYLCRDGSYKWLRWMVAPYEDLWYSVAHDITAIKQADAALHLANEELEERVQTRTKALQRAMQEAERANAAKSEFLSRMSHELRTPLNSILGFAQIMEMDAPTDKQALRLGHIIQAGQKLLQLINEVLDMAHVEAGCVSASSQAVQQNQGVDG